MTFIINQNLLSFTSLSLGVFCFIYRIHSQRQSKMIIKKKKNTEEIKSVTFSKPNKKFGFKTVLQTIATFPLIVLHIQTSLHMYTSLSLVQIFSSFTQSVTLILFYFRFRPPFPKYRREPDKKKILVPMSQEDLYHIFFVKIILFHLRNLALW